MTQPAENDVTQEYALRIDCQRNGCPKPHGDDGFILPSGIESEAVERVNGHAVTFVVRDVIRSPWRDLTRDIPPAVPSPDREGSASAGPKPVDGLTHPCPTPGYGGHHTAVGAGAISSPYLCHGCGTWFTLPDREGSDQ